MWAEGLRTPAKKLAGFPKASIIQKAAAKVARAMLQKRIDDQPAFRPRWSAKRNSFCIGILSVSG